MGRQRRISLLLSCAATLACTVAHAEDPVTLRFSFWGSDREIQNFREIANAFEAVHPNVKLKLEGLPWGDYWTKLKTQAAGRRAPDVIRMYTGEAAAWFHRGVMLDLRDRIARDGIKLDEHFKVGVDASTWEGNVYCLPTDIAIRVYAYDKDLFDKAGVPYLDPKKPLTWDELVAVCKRLTQRKGDAVDVYGLSLGYKSIDTFVYQAGGQVVNRIVNPTSMRINTPEAVAGLRFYSDLIHKYKVCVPPATQQDSGFGAPDFALLSGRVAIAHNGPWALSTYKEKKGLRFGLAPIARGAKRVQTCTVNSCGVYAFSKHPEEAWQFVKFVAGRQGQELVAKLGVGIPSLKAVAYSGHFLKGPSAAENMEVFLDEVQHARVNIMTPTGELDREKQRILGERMALNQLPAEEAAQELQAIGDRILSPEARVITPFVRKTLPAIICAAIVVLLTFVSFAAHSHGKAEAARGGGKRENLLGYLFISPWLVGFVLFMAFPIAAAVGLSFTDWDIFSPVKWVGAQNFVDMFSAKWRDTGQGENALVFNDASFWQSLKVTFVYVLCALPIQLAGGLAAALLLNMNLRGSRIFRTILYLPFLFSGVAVSFIFLWLYSPEYGLINYAISVAQTMTPWWWPYALATVLGAGSCLWIAIALLVTVRGRLSLRAFAIHGLAAAVSCYCATLLWEVIAQMGVEWPPQWLTSETWALPGIILMNVMWIGGNMLIFQAGLRGIPTEMYESAEVDGAGVVAKFLHITIPMLTPTILFNLIMGTIGSFQVFTQAYVMTKGGPNRATLFYVLYLYNRAFQDFQMGYACALAMILFLVIFAFTYFQLWSAKRWVFYEVS